MNIISVDNCYEDDGLVQAQALLASFNRLYPDGTPADILIAILPEYRPDGRLDRLNFVTRRPGDPDHEPADLVAAAGRIIRDEQAKRAAAYAAADQPIGVVEMVKTS